MSRPDAIAAAALDAHSVRPVFFCYLDIVGDPLRACTAGASIPLAGTGDPDLDGFTFEGINPTVVEIGQVRQKDGGSDSVTARLSGLITLDNELLNLVGDRANWQGRTARLWRMIRDEFGTQRGALQPYYTGWMTSLQIAGSPSDQRIELTIQSYLAAYTAASNRSYLDQSSFDPDDLSAQATIAIANGNSGNPLVNGTPGSADAGYPSSGGYGGGIYGLTNLQ